MTKYPDFDQILSVEVKDENGKDLSEFPLSKKVSGERYVILGPTYLIEGTDNLPKEQKGDKKAYTFNPLEPGEKIYTALPTDPALPRLKILITSQIKLNMKVSRQY